MERIRAAVCARAAGLADIWIAEVAQDRGPETRVSVGILHHAEELRVFERPPARGLFRIQRGAGPAMRRVVLPWRVDKKPPGRDVGIIPQQRCGGGAPVSAGAA